VHGSHVTLEAIEQTKDFGLNMIILPSNTSHALQPLDVACFKPFKTIFKKERDTIMVRKNDIKVDKITLVGWVNKALDQALTSKNIMPWFKSTGIWPLKSNCTTCHLRY
jgi:hypothetical protein